MSAAAKLKIIGQLNVVQNIFSPEATFLLLIYIYGFLGGFFLHTMHFCF